MKEKFGGSSELMVVCGVSGWSQVSVRHRISMLWSRMICLRISGLLWSVVIEEADRILKVARFMVGLVTGLGLGPGFSSTSPARSKRHIVSRLLVERCMQRLGGMRDFGLKM